MGTTFSLNSNSTHAFKKLKEPITPNDQSNHSKRKKTYLTRVIPECVILKTPIHFLFYYYLKIKKIYINSLNS